MSRTHILAVAVICLAIGAPVALGQGFYLTGNLGYGISAGTQSLGTNATSTGATTQYEGVYGSLGEGFKFGISGGYMFSKNLGAELAASYWLGNTFDATFRTTTTTQDSKLSGTGFVGIPSFVLSANMAPVNPYARLGLVFGVMNVKREYKIEQPGQISEYVVEETGDLAFGYAAGLGFSLPLGGILDLFAEGTLHSVTYSPAQYEITKYTVNGVDRLSTVTTKKYDYKDSFDSNDANTTLSIRRPFSTLGILLGVKFNL